MVAFHKEIIPNTVHVVPTIKTIIQDILQYGAYICGGYPAYIYNEITHKAIYSQNNYSDYDIYVANQLGQGFVYNYLVSKFGKEDDQSKFSYTWRKFKTPLTKNIQLIKFSVHNKQHLEEILEDFDLNVCQVAFISPTELYLSDYAKRGIEKLRLRVIEKSMKNIVSTTARIIKYSIRGYHIDWNELAKLYVYYTQQPQAYQQQVQAMIKQSQKANQNGSYGNLIGSGPGASVASVPKQFIQPTFSTFTPKDFQEQIEKIVKDANEKICNCDINTLIAKGCQCGGK